MKKKIKQWYLKYCDADIVTMTRVQLAGVGPALVWADMSEEEQDLLVANAKIILENPAFSIVIDTVMNGQRDYAMNYSQHWEEVKFGRGQISGASLVREVMEKFASMTQVEASKFNKFDSI